MSNTVESVKKLILNAVHNASGWTTIFWPSNGPEPENQYCLVALKGIYKQERDVINWTKSETAVTEHQRSESTLEFEIQVRGNDALTVADKIVSYFDSQMRDVDLWPYVGSGGHDDVQDVSVYHQGKWLPVAVVNIYIHTTLPKQNVIEFMNTLDITTKIYDNEFTTTIPQKEES